MLTYKQLDERDEGLVNDFFDACGGESRAMFNRRDYNRRRALKYCKKPDASRIYFAVYLDGEPIGLVFLLDFDTAVPELGLAIKDAYAGHGLGFEIAEYAIQFAKESGAGGMYLTTHIANVRAQALYEKLGFKLIGPTKDSTELAYLMRFKRSIQVQ